MNDVSRQHSTTPLRSDGIRKLYRDCVQFLGHACLALLSVPDRVRLTVRHKRELRSFLAEQNNLRKDRLDAEMHDVRAPWTMQTAFYATSGSYVYRSRYTTGETVDTLDLRTLEFLASREPETLLPLRIAASQNPGQASGIIKIITCIQAAWFCSQCIARMSSGIAISLLELNTFAHCVSAFFIYGFWWHKPYDVTSHTFIQCKMLDYLFLVRAAVNSSLRASLARRHASVNVQEADFEQEERTQFLKITESAMIPGIEFYLQRRNLPDVGSRVFYLPEESLIHWQRLWRFKVETSFSMASADRRMARPQPPRRFADIGNRLTTLSLAIAFPSAEEDGYGLSYYTCFILDIAFILYGGLHLLAWRYHFRTTAESTLWRIAGIITTSSGITVHLLVMSAHHGPIRKLRGQMGSNIIRRLASIYYYIALVVAIAWIPIIVVARTYLFVESFVALPNSPPSTYTIPPWTAYVPHI
jgi:hypothetical protein